MFVLEELVYIFESQDLEILLGEFRPFQVGEFSFLERAVVGPLGERNAEKILGFASGVVIGEGGSGEGSGCGLDEITAFHSVSFGMDAGDGKSKLWKE